MERGKQVVENDGRLPPFFYGSMNQKKVTEHGQN
jgi:hypothetical protein